MATDIESFRQPISEAEPCGPDLELSGDMDFMNFIARADGLLPARFFEFDPATIDFNKEFAAIFALLERTRDLRLFVLYCKLSLLNRDIVSFVKAMETIAALLQSQWVDVHPRGEDGDFMMRVAVLQSLEDPPHIILPLQTVTLIQNRRYGALSFRSYLIAAERVTPREGETQLDMSTIERIVFESEPEVVLGRRDEMRRIAAAVKQIEAVSMDAGGYDGRVTLEPLANLADEIADFLDRQIASRNPPEESDDGGPDAPIGAEASGPTSGAGTIAGAPSPVKTQAIATRRDALAALQAARAYFETFEPSSPSLLLIRYAENLANKTFYEVIQALMPDHYSRASIRIGQNAIKLNVERLSSASSSGGGSYESSYENTDSAATDDRGQEDAATFAIPQTRRDAMKLLDAVVAFFRQSEPVSPVPLLITRAKEIGERDFVNLLKELFSDSTLRSIKGDDEY